MPVVIAELWRYPVKSMGGEPLRRAVLDGKIVGDREWGVFDAVTGKLLAAKTLGALLGGRAGWDDATRTTTIELPDGTRFVAGDPDANALLGAWLGRPVVLRRAGDAPATVEMEIDEGDDAGPLGMKSFTTPSGSLFDSRSTLHVIGDASLAAVEREHGAGAGDRRRYRPNLVVAGLAEFAEDDWVGRDVKVGGVVAHVRKRTVRCVMPSRAQPGLARDRGLLRYLKTQRRFELGVYLDPRGPGEVAVDDVVEP